MAMSDDTTTYTGGCLCGALRYEAVGEPRFAGHCYCADCRKASGSGFVPFMGFASGDLRITGQTQKFATKAASGADAIRNSCPVCGSLVFGGEPGKAKVHTIYAGTLDEPSLFRPTVAVFTGGRPAWAAIPAGLTVYERGF
jgi:hypothetical protein